MPGGHVDYLAEVDATTAARLRGVLPEVDAELAALALGTDPRRAAYAEVGGPRTSLAWAERELDGLADVDQQRTWNLSSLWRLTASDGRAAWLKQVPEFFAHESIVLAWLARAAPSSTPPLIAAGAHGRQLLGHVEGTDLYDADDATRVEIARRAHDIQLSSVADVDELVDRGVPDRRGHRLTAWIRVALADHVGAHPASELLERLDTSVAEPRGVRVPGHARARRRARRQRRGVRRPARGARLGRLVRRSSRVRRRHAGRRPRRRARLGARGVVRAVAGICSGVRPRGLRWPSPGRSPPCGRPPCTPTSSPASSPARRRTTGRTSPSCSTSPSRSRR